MGSPPSGKSVTSPPPPHIWHSSPFWTRACPLYLRFFPTKLKKKLEFYINFCGLKNCENVHCTPLTVPRLREVLLVHDRAREHHIDWSNFFHWVKLLLFFTGFFSWGGTGGPPIRQKFCQSNPSDTCPRFWTKACPPSQGSSPKIWIFEYLFVSNLTTFKLKST